MIIILIDLCISRNQKVDIYEVRVQIKYISTIINTIKNSTVVSCTGKIHLIVIIVNDGYNIDIKGGLCLYGGGHPLFFNLNIFNPRSLTRTASYSLIWFTYFFRSFKILIKTLIKKTFYCNSFRLS